MQEGEYVSAATSVLAHLVWILGITCSFLTGIFCKPPGRFGGLICLKLDSRIRKSTWPYTLKPNTSQSTESEQMGKGVRCQPLAGGTHILFLQGT